MKFNTRIAPSPTGNLHIGTVRTAYFNYLASRSTGGKFLLRIDDTDQKRSLPEYTQAILDTFKWLDFDYDELVFQSQRLQRYNWYANTLIISGFAKKIEHYKNHESQGDSIILNLPKDFEYITSWDDLIGGNIKVSKDDFKHINGMVLIKADGYPTYNFATVVDDLDFDINLIIRGVDHISNTARQITIFKLLGKSAPNFAHVGLITVDGKPMSKRDNSASILNYREKGYEPEAILNFLVRMGWGPKVDDKSTSLLPREKMLELFLDGGKMRSSYSNFDQAKLDSFNRKYKALRRTFSEKNI